MAGFHEVDAGLNLGHAAPREGASAEVQRLAAIKEAAKAAAKLVGAQGAAPGGQGRQGSLGAHLAPPPAQNGQGSQQASQACAPRSAHQERAGPADGVPLARKAGPQPKAQRASPSVVDSTAAKENTPREEKKPKKKKTKKKKAL